MHLETRDYVIYADTNTVFAQSDGVDTIYFINQFCVASIWALHLFNSVKTFCQYMY